MATEFGITVPVTCTLAGFVVSVPAVTSPFTCVLSAKPDSTAGEDNISCDAVGLLSTGPPAEFLWKGFQSPIRVSNGCLVTSKRSAVIAESAVHPPRLVLERFPIAGAFVATRRSAGGKHKSDRIVPLSWSDPRPFWGEADKNDIATQGSWKDLEAWRHSEDQEAQRESFDQRGSFSD